MAIAFAQAKTMIAAVIGEDDADTLADIERWLDIAQRDVARSRPWPELLKRGVLTLTAPYATGTVAVTQDSTTVTLTGGTWPADIASAEHRFAPSYGGEYYKVATRSSDTVILLEQAWKGETDAAMAYVTYKVDYPLASDLDTVEEMRLHDHNDGEVIPLSFVTPGQMTRMSFTPEDSDRPTAFHFIEPSTEAATLGYKQIRVGPSAPDDNYRIEYLYRKVITEGSFVLSEALVDLVMERAKALAYERDHYQKYLRSMALYNERIEREWANVRDDATGEIIVGQERVTGVGREEPFNVNWRSLEL